MGSGDDTPLPENMVPYHEQEDGNTEPPVDENGASPLPDPDPAFYDDYDEPAENGDPPGEPPFPETDIEEAFNENPSGEEPYDYDEPAENGDPPGEPAFPETGIEEVLNENPSGEESYDYDDPVDEGTEETEEPLEDAFDTPGGASLSPENESYDEEQPYDYSDPTEQAGEEYEDNTGQPPLTTSRLDGQTVEPFTPAEKKDSAEQVFARNKPLKLDRQFILILISSVLILFVVFATFIIPLLKTQKKDTKPIPEPVTGDRVTDYYTMARRERGDDGDEYYDYDTGSKDVYKEPDTFQVRAPEYVYAEPVPVPAGTGGGGAIPERPNTRNDRLQAKSISGIKGLTGTRQNYLSPPVLQQPSRPSPSESSNPSNPYAQFGLPPKEEYTAALLSRQQQAQQASALAGNAYAAQNDQSGKYNFYSRGWENAGDGQWLNPLTVWQGAVIEAVLSTNINTDLPGECAAIVSKSLYNSLDGKYMVIPQNSRLFGSYNSSISYSQGRVQVGWHTLIRPDGYQISLGNMQAADAQGAAGLKGFINDHPFQYLKALGLITAFNIINTDLAPSAQTSGDNQYVQNLMANTQNIINTFGSKIIDRAMDVQPTIIIKSGLKINVVVNQNLILPPLEPYPVSRPYHREK
jgi:type IV secretion system protein VirB10